MGEKQIPRKKKTEIELEIPESKHKLKSNLEKMKWINISREELFKLIGALIYIIYVISACLALVFNARGLFLLF